MPTVTSPFAGRALALESVPDPVFSEAMVGHGAAVDPERESSVAVAPLDGVIVSMHPHAFVVSSDDGHGVLVHLGVDTVQLNGEGFAPLVRKGDRVRRGDGIVRWDPAAVEAAGKSPVCPVIALDSVVDALGELRDSGDIAVGDPLFVWE